MMFWDGILWLLLSYIYFAKQKKVLVEKWIKTHFLNLNDFQSKARLKLHGVVKADGIKTFFHFTIIRASLQTVYS